jgi:hypothetical protein
MSKEDLLKKAKEFDEGHTSLKSRNEKIIAAKEAKQLVLDMNEIYKVTKEVEIMDMMKRITVIKQKLEKRLKGRLTA